MHGQLCTALSRQRNKKGELHSVQFSLSGHEQIRSA
jgi:hypothetical protein